MRSMFEWYGPWWTREYVEAHYAEWRELTRGRTWSVDGLGLGPPGWEAHVYTEIVPYPPFFFTGQFSLKPL